MKNKLLTITLLFFQFTLLAQNEELQKIYNALDTMIKKESHYFPKRSDAISIFFYSYEKIIMEKVTIVKQNSK